MKRILVADDHDLLRDALVSYFEAEADFEVDSVGDYPAAVDAVEQGGGYDLVVLDFNMPGMTGIGSLTEMMALKGGQRVALISGSASSAVAEQALEAGAAGFLPKSLPARAVIAAVQQMIQGDQFAPPTQTSDATDDSLPDTPLYSQLSLRERQVWQGLAQGKANKQIARDLDVAEPTVKLHVKTLYRKLGVANRTQAAILAREAGVS